jgi:1,4-dihydroxy-2-naphthoyl-CoA synthase
MNFALLASWDPNWISDHKNWLAIYGEHSDGWKNSIKQENIDLLISTENRIGHVWFYAYLPKSKGGDMKVRHRLKINNIQYSKELHMTSHIKGEVRLKHHDTPINYDARLTFNIIAIEDLKPIDPKTLITSKNEYVIGGSQLLSILVIQDNKK